MEKTFESVYENGVRRPLVALPLVDGQRVRLTIASDLQNDAQSLVGAEEWEAAKLDPITREDTWRATASIQGSLADALIASREDRF